ncbi:MAG: DUF4384 domain-containing protein [Planctomycetia bacterium]
MFSPARRTLAVLGFGMAAALVQHAAMAAEPPPPTSGTTRTRNIVRNKLPADAKVIGLEFTVLKLDSVGIQSAVDPEAHAFQIGDSFLVKIRPQDDVYVYVFTEGPQGKRACLLPEDAGEPLLVKQGVEISLPENGDAFTFEPPAGEEKLIVVALKQPNPDLDLLAAAAFKAPGKTLSNTEQEQQARTDAALDGLRERGGSSVRLRGGSGLEEQVRASLNRAEENHRQLVTPPDDTTRHTEVVGVNTSEIIIDIPLRSQTAAQK